MQHSNLQSQQQVGSQSKSPRNSDNQKMQSQSSNSAPQKQAPAANPNNLFFKLQKAIVAVQEEKNGSQVKNLCSLIDKMTPRLFLKACKEKGDSIMEFIGPEIEDNDGDIKKAIESVGDFVSEVVWAEILREAQLS